MTAMTTAGSRFATLTFFPHTRLIPTQKIRIEPIRDRFDRAVSVIIGLISLARQVIEPWKSSTGIAENIQPLPNEQVITIIIIRSRIAFVVNME